MSFQDFVRQAKTKAQAEAAKSTAGVRTYVESFTTSRISMALSLLLFIVFTSTAIYAPERLAPLAKIGLAQNGLLAQGPTLDLSDFNVTSAQQQEKAQEALTQATPEVVKAYNSAADEFPALPRWLNVLGAVLSFGALLYTFKIQVRAARASTKSVAL